jgi:hypothetical protein
MAAELGLMVNTSRTRNSLRQLVLRRSGGVRYFENSVPFLLLRMTR